MAAASGLGLHRTGNDSKSLAMSSSLDHSISYYSLVPHVDAAALYWLTRYTSHDFNCAEWMLYVVDSPAAGSGRGYVRGLASIVIHHAQQRYANLSQMYSRDGKLLAAMTQEGVIRAGGSRPEKVIEPHPKL